MPAVKVVKIEAGGLIRLPLDLLESVGLEPGEEAEVRPEAGELVLEDRNRECEICRGNIEPSLKTFWKLSAKLKNTRPRMKKGDEPCPNP
jgi:hypothetical protein